LEFHVLLTFSEGGNKRREAEEEGKTKKEKIYIIGKIKKQKKIYNTTAVNSTVKSRKKYRKERKKTDQLNIARRMLQ